MSGQPNNSDNDKLILGIFLLLIVGVCYWFFAPVVQEFFLTIKMWQMKWISIVIPTEENKQFYSILQNIPSVDLNSEQVSIISRKVNMYLLPLFLAFSAYCYNSARKYLYSFEKHKNKNYTIDTLMYQEVNNVWLYLKPIIHENLLENKSPDWARAVKPQEYVLHNDLLNVPDDLTTLNSEKTKKMLALQLGKLYTGVEQIPPYIQSLIGCFAEHLYGVPLRATIAFMDIADSYGEEAAGRYDYSKGLELFNKHKNNPELIKYLDKHAYVYTGISEIFQDAKERGIIISKYFLWLKKTDRRLYYMLNAIGRQVSWIECAGITDHYQHEMALNRPLAKIFVDSALEGLKEELEHVKITSRSKELYDANKDKNRRITEQVFSGAV